MRGLRAHSSTLPSAVVRVDMVQVEPLDEERGPAHPRAGEVRFHGDRRSSPSFMPPRATARHPNVLREGAPSPGPPSQGAHIGGAAQLPALEARPKCVQTERVRRQGRAEGRAKRDHRRKGHRAQCSPIRLHTGTVFETTGRGSTKSQRRWSRARARARIQSLLRPFAFGLLQTFYMSVSCHCVPFPRANRRRTTHRRSKHELLDHRHVCAVASAPSATHSEFTSSSTTTGQFTSTTTTGQFADDAGLHRRRQSVRRRRQSVHRRRRAHSFRLQRDSWSTACSRGNQHIMKVIAEWYHVIPLATRW